MFYIQKTIINLHWDNWIRQKILLMGRLYLIAIISSVLHVIKLRFLNSESHYTNVKRWSERHLAGRSSRYSHIFRMCTVIKRQADNLKFLEDTRQHLSRLPTIDPDTRTLILCGFPNVGKSSFINKVCHYYDAQNTLEYYSWNCHCLLAVLPVFSFNLRRMLWDSLRVTIRIAALCVAVSSSALCLAVCIKSVIPLLQSLPGL